ncbi:MAG: hypothetical protein COB20_08060 [SAR86 cluster bacterium]|uniref:Uncharacterized protein n=1 Tax=SAR86 cluster bacterium TaxID=2030880 RepID=A0A2A4X440_9GAMM|nr:MAG: hypothetical protein COB20_08060 [SAR86 cluster bacterium]
MKWYWQLYSLLLLLLGFGQMIRKLISDTGGFSSRYAAALVAVIIVLALVAKSKELHLGKVWMWKSLFLILGIGSVAMALFGFYLGFTGVYFPASLLCGAAIVLMPALQELYVYSYESPDIWALAHNNQIKSDAASGTPY